MDITNKGNLPEDFHWDVLGQLFDAVEMEGRDIIYMKIENKYQVQ